jgi:hypothetical protein
VASVDADARSVRSTVAATGDAIFNNDQGPDTKTHVLYDIYAAGEVSVQKGLRR